MTSAAHGEGGGSDDTRPARGHILLGAALLGLPVGSVYAWSVFVQPIADARPNWESGAAVQAFSVFIWFLGLSSAVAGKRLPTLGPRLCGLFGAVLNVCGVGIMALCVYCNIMTGLWIGAVFFGIGLGTAYVSFIFALRKWFSDRPGFASGYAMCSGSSGSFVFAAVNGHILDALRQKGVNTPHSVALGLAVYGGIMFVLQVAGALMLSVPETPPPKDAEKGNTAGTAKSKDAKAAAPLVLTTREVVTSRQFWLLWLVFVILLTAMMGILSQLAVLMEDVWHRSRSTSVWMVAVINMCGTFMRLWVGVAADKVGARALTYTSFLAQAVVFAFLPCAIMKEIFGLALAMLIIAKIGFGAAFTLVNLLVSRTFGPANASQVFGFLVSALTIAGVIGPICLRSMIEHVHLSSLGVDSGVQLFCYIMAGTMVLGAMCLFVLAPHPVTSGGYASERTALLTQDTKYAAQKSGSFHLESPKRSRA